METVLKLAACAIPGERFGPLKMMLERSWKTTDSEKICSDMNIVLLLEREREEWVGHTIHTIKYSLESTKD